MKFKQGDIVQLIDSSTLTSSAGGKRYLSETMCGRQIRDLNFVVLQTGDNYPNANPNLKDLETNENYRNDLKLIDPISLTLLYTCSKFGVKLVEVPRVKTIVTKQGYVHKFQIFDRIPEFTKSQTNWRLVTYQVEE